MPYLSGISWHPDLLLSLLLFDCHCRPLTHIKLNLELWLRVIPVAGYCLYRQVPLPIRKIIYCTIAIELFCFLLIFGSNTNCSFRNCSLSTLAPAEYVLSFSSLLNILTSNKVGRVTTVSRSNPCDHEDDNILFRVIVIFEVLLLVPDSALSHQRCYVALRLQNILPYETYRYALYLHGCVPFRSPLRKPWPSQQFSIFRLPFAL